MNRVLTTPTTDDWPDSVSMAINKIEFPKYDTNLLFNKVPIPGVGFELLEAMLNYDPKKRISASKILQHDFFLDYDRTLVAPTLNFASNTNSNSASNSSSGSLVE